MFYHASQMVHVIDFDQLFDAKFLVSCARLSVTVNKKCVFAYLNDDSVTYQTLQWDNPKLREVYAGIKLEASQPDVTEGENP
jgi:tRNA splicing endonuclease